VFTLYEGQFSPQWPFPFSGSEQSEPFFLFDHPVWPLIVPEAS
jgi:hypothetical protein